MAEISGALHSRPDHAIRVDKGRKAKTTTKDVRRWARVPNRLYNRGIYTPDARDKHLSARTDILANINQCSKKKACQSPDNIRKVLVSTGKYDHRDIAAVEAAEQADYFNS